MTLVKTATGALTAVALVLGLGAPIPASALSANARFLWPKGSQIPVCWESLESDPFFRSEVQYAVEDTWMTQSSIVFYGWDQCQPNSRGIRIKVDNTAWPMVKADGVGLDGMPGGMILNFDVDKLSKGFDKLCRGAPVFCIRAIAVHEFGHAMAFQHEQNRSDRPRADGCVKAEYQGGVRRHNELNIDRYDPFSIMNYCNPDWSGNGKLSPGDISAISEFYPL